MGEKIIRCLKPVKNLSYLNFNLVIFDSGSTNRTKEKSKKEFKKVKLIENKKFWGY